MLRGKVGRYILVLNLNLVAEINVWSICKRDNLGESTNGGLDKIVELTELASILKVSKFLKRGDIFHL